MSDLRVVVVGTSCSGKTTLARRIASACKLPHVELDALHWLPGWTERPLPEFRAAVAQATAGDQWVVDGNYSKARAIYWPRLTDVVWLNLAFPLVFWRALNRTYRRAITRQELFGGNYETFGRALFDRDSILWWVITSHRRRQREFQALFQETGALAFRLHEIRKDQEAERVVGRLRGMTTEAA